MLNKVIFSKKIIKLKLWLLLLNIFKCQARDLRSNSTRNNEFVTTIGKDEMLSDSFKLDSAYNVAEVETQRSQMENYIYNNTTNFVGTEVKENWNTREPNSEDDNSQKSKKNSNIMTRFKKWLNTLYYSSGGSALEENRQKGVGHLFEDFEPIESTVPEPSMHRANSPKRLANPQVQTESVIEPIPNAQIGKSEVISQNPPSNDHIEPLPKTQVVESQPISQNPPGDQHTVQPPHPQNQSTTHEPKMNENPAPIIKVKKVKNPFPKPKKNTYAAVFKAEEEKTKLQGAEQTVRKVECCILNNCKPGSSSCGCCAGVCVQGGCCVCCGCIFGWLTAAFWAEFFTKIGNRLGFFH